MGIVEKTSFGKMKAPFLGLFPVKEGKMSTGCVYWKLYPDRLLHIRGMGSLDFNLRDFYIGEEWEPYYQVFVDGNFSRVGYSSFSDWPSLGSVVLPQSIKRIEDRAFSDCDNLTYLKIPGDLEYIGQGAFAYCNEKITVEFYDTRITNDLTINFFKQMKATILTGDFRQKKDAIE